MPLFPRHPAIWLSALACWFGLLWFLSSLTGAAPKLPPFPHFDKLAHFGYFLIGGFLLTGWFFTRNPAQASWKWIIVTAILVITAIGGIDEWHQCFTPGRCGGDPWDWLADLLGGASGCLILKAIHHRLR